MAFLLALWGRLAPYALGAAGVILAASLTAWWFYDAGRDAAEAEQTARTIEAVEVRHAVEDDVRRDPGAAADRLREWQRD